MPARGLARAGTALYNQETGAKGTAMIKIPISAITPQPLLKDAASALLGLGCPFTIFGNLRQFENSAPPSAGGIILVDYDYAKSLPNCTLRDFLAGLKLRYPRSLLILTAQFRASGGDAAMLESLDAGADDFLALDMNIAVLSAKMRAYLRRLAPERPDGATGAAVRLDARLRKVWLSDKGRWQEAATLTPREFSIFALLLGRAGQAVRREEILEDIWQARAGEVNAETVDKHVESLRKKLGRFGRKIKTLYGTGYYLDEAGGSRI
ncbi:MAG: response regulator transcription factor [Elusimicrobiales bacterium]|nr:response regulator transcription factor [Elusimicrobiales bacterium]